MNEKHAVDSGLLQATALRREAEQRLRDKEATPAQSMTEVDVRALLHELQVHQIELEMQNAELLYAQKALQESSNKYHDLFDFAPVGYFRLDKEGQILEVNLAGAALMGLDRSTAIHKRFAQSVAIQSRARFADFLTDMLRADDTQTCEIELQHDQTRRYALLEGILSDDVGGNPSFRFAAIDITSRKRIDDVQMFLLRCGHRDSGEDFFQSLGRYLAQSLGMDYVCIDRLVGDGLTAQTVAIYHDGKFDDNVTYALKDTPCGDVVGKTICCFPKGVCQLFPKDVVLQELRAESYVGSTLWSFDGKPIGLIAIVGRKPLGQPLLAESILKLVAIRAAGELERKQAEESLRLAHDHLERRVQERTAELAQRAEQLRASAVELTQVEQRERRRLAQVLHDHLQQLLVAARIKVGLLRRQVQDERLGTTIGQVDDLLNETINESRSLAVQLGPPALYNQGLAAGLEWLACETREKFDLAVEVRADPAAEPPEETLRVFLFRAASELLLNAAKHANARCVQVRMTRVGAQASEVPPSTGTTPASRGPEHVCIEVCDDGVGFDPAKVTEKTGRGGFGMFSIRQRVEVFGGQVEALSRPGQGTRVTIWVPLGNAVE